VVQRLTLQGLSQLPVFCLVVEMQLQLYRLVQLLCAYMSPDAGNMLLGAAAAAAAAAAVRLVSMLNCVLAASQVHMCIKPCVSPSR